MILRRLTTSLGTVSTSLRTQNWVAIAIEFVLVVLGVFLGIAAANWNQERLERRETRKLLSQLDVELSDWLRYIDSVEQYYAAAGRYADRAAAGWVGDGSVTDEEFVIAAYQASQITAVGNNASTWSAIWGAGNLRDIEDLRLRQSLAAIMTFDYSSVDIGSVSSRYREEVRKVIPDNVQSAIREQCGDRIVGRGTLVLPARCDLSLAPDSAASTAAALRAKPQLLGELNWHRALVANQLAQAQILEQNARVLTEYIAD